MSTTTTVEAGNESLQNVLRAYDLHHSGTEEQSSLQRHARGLETGVSPLRVSTAENRLHEDPVTSLSSRRRVPPYRETSRSHSLSSRPAGLDAASEIIVPAMFVGVFLQSCLNRAWRATGEKLNSKIFEYKIGGEW